MSISVGDLVAKLSVDSSGLDSAGDSFKRLNADMSKEFDAMRGRLSEMAPAAEKVAGSMGASFAKGAQTAATAISAISGTLLTVVGNATRIAANWETEFTGVRKTVDGTRAEMKALEDQLRQLATVIPISTKELAAIAENAGALGVKKEAIAGFTETVAKIATTTNLTADSAATSFARIGSIMNVASDDFGKMGSALVELGNKGESTEREIIGVATRLSGAARTVGFSADQLLGVAAGMANVGIRAEMGGTAMSEILTKIAREVNSNGKHLEDWAKLAGMSAEQFSEAFKTNAAGALVAVVEGMGKVQQSGGNLFGVLDDLNIKQTRQRDTLTRLASTHEKFAGTMDTAKSAWQENAAMNIEAAKRYETTESKISLVQAKLKDTSITLGQVFLPVVNSMLDALEPVLKQLADWAQAFSELDPSTQRFIGGLIVIGTAAGPAVMALAGIVGAIQKMIPIVQGAFTLLMAHPFMALAGAAIVLATIIVMNWDKIKAAFEALGDTIKRWGQMFNQAIDSAVFGTLNAFKRLKDDAVMYVRQMVDQISNYLSEKLTATLNRIKEPIQQATAWFKDMYDKVVGHSYVPEMVDEIGNHIKKLDTNLVAPARAAAISVEAAFRGLQITTAGIFETMRSQMSYAFGSGIQAVSGAITDSIMGLDNWKKAGEAVLRSFLNTAITTALQIAASWLISLATRQAATTSTAAAELATHTATESAKTAATTAGEMARLGIVTATNKVMMAGTISALGAIGAVGNAALATMQVVVSTTSAVLAAIGSGLAASIVGAPMAPAYFAAATAIGTLGTASVAAGVGALQAAIGTAIGVATTALLTPFAAGGIVTGPTMGLVGEAGPEAIIPLDQLGNLGGDITITLELDGRTVTQIVLDNMPGEYRRRMGNR